MPREPAAASPLDQRIAANLRRVRLARGWSQLALSEALGLSQQQIQKYEKGANRLSLSRALEIARLLEVDIAELYAEASEECA